MNRIKQIRESQNLTQAELAELMGTTDATVQRLEAGKRKLKEKWIRIAASALKVSNAEILGDIIPPPTQGLKVIGKVQAGVWREAFADERKKQTLPLGRDPRFPHADQYALEVLGDSMDKVFPEGQFIVCAKWADVGRDVRDGDLVVVHFHRNGTTESTVKRARITRGKIKLMPESTNPKWQMPIDYEQDPEFSEVVITGLVIGRYEPL